MTNFDPNHIDRMALRRFALGMCSDDEESRIAQAVIADESTAERLSAAQMLLADDYVAGELNETEKLQMRARLRDNPELARLVSESSQLLTLRKRRRLPLVWIALAAGLAIFGIITAPLYQRSIPSVPPVLTQATPPRDIVWQLKEGRVRDAVQAVNAFAAPHPRTMVTLEFVTAPMGATARLETTEGRVLWSGTTERNPTGGSRVRVTGQVFSKGDYILFVDGLRAMIVTVE